MDSSRGAELGIHYGKLKQEQGAMLGKKGLFYLVTASVAGIAAQASGANAAVVLLVSFLVPPTALLLVAIIRHNDGRLR